MLSDRRLLCRPAGRLCLNPCSAGLCSPTFATCVRSTCSGHVLILVLLDYALRPKVICLFRSSTKVLILVLLDYALRRCPCRLRPYFVRVLILVLLDYALRPKIKKGHKEFACLNPCSAGLCSPTSLINQMNFCYES